MAPELVEAIAAGVVGATVLYLVGQPFWDTRPPAVAPWEPPDPEETPRGQALLALHEIEFDRATGKLSDADFTALHARYSARALALLDAEPRTGDETVASDPVEALVAAHVATTALTEPGGRRCVTHGERPGEERQFCSTCGQGLLTAEGRCAGCGATIPEDGRFCPGCGRPVRSVR